MHLSSKRNESWLHMSTWSTSHNLCVKSSYTLHHTGCSAFSVFCLFFSVLHFFGWYRLTSYMYVKQRPSTFDFHFVTHEKKKLILKRSIFRRFAFMLLSELIKLYITLHVGQADFSNTFITFDAFSFPCTHPHSHSTRPIKSHRIVSNVDKCRLPFTTRYHKHVRQNAKKFLF